MKYTRKIKFGLLELPYFTEIDGKTVPVYLQRYDGDNVIVRTEDDVELIFHYKLLSIGSIIKQ